jgi:nucleoside-diphosphate-sugar epimerase
VDPEEFTTAVQSPMVSGAVLVTGAAGRLGGQICRKLIAAGVPVVGTDLAAAVPEWASSGKVDYLPSIDLTDIDSTKRLFSTALAPITACVHVAAWPGPAVEPPFPRWV